MIGDTLGIACAVAMLGLAGAAAVAQDRPAANAPALRWAFSARVELAAPVEQGQVDGKRMRFVPITGGRVYGPRLSGTVLPGGGDWQAIGPDGLTEVNARYALRTADGTVIDIVNSGVRTATPAVSDRIARGEAVGPDDYYFRTVPRFTVGKGQHEWLRRTLFVARGVRLPDHVVIDFYEVT
ncbi:UPF0311 protein [Sphingomonas metalli]|uniref:UPF0311 protein GCM10011380_21200 n=1 Tax=Sphingomonas metalli TaxID=1779358 RepID=A0A916T709_9SPHN|nr:DUF3237 domain-containing protein [Sphingomonas metalli]GGB31592.1 UPF0311 protein [Sphingomonas metalli]